MTDNLLNAILKDLKTKTVAQFQLNYTGWYLFGGPLLEEEGDISYQTDVISPLAFQKLIADTNPGRIHSKDIANGQNVSDSQFVYEIRKKPTNAFSDWITIGRAMNNDIVLRYPTISKLHARFEIEETAFGDLLGFQLIDNNSTGRTVHNGVFLKENQKAPVCIGDVILFGNIQCMVLDATRLWDLLG